MTAPAAKLSIQAKGQAPQQFALNHSNVLLGAAPDNTLVLSDPEVSQHHARLIWQEQQFFVEDLGSATGTTVNGIKLLPRAPEPLQDNDVIQLGDFVLNYNFVNGELDNVLPPLPGTIIVGSTATPLLLAATKQWLQEFPLKQDVMVIGRDPRCDIQIDHPSVSMRHALLTQTEQGYEITDLGSKNGLSLYQTTVAQHLLQDGDVIQIGPDLTLTYVAVPVNPGTEHLAPLNLQDRQVISLGRDPSNDEVIEHPVVSLFHARIERADGQWMISDLNSSNGTFVNGRQIDGKTSLNPGDRIRIGPYQVVFNGDQTLLPLNEAGNLRLDALNLAKTTPKGVVLLDDVSLSILPREFVAIVGGSGAGKSTLLDALNGFRPATKGLVLVNANDLYKNFNAYRTEVGYVPQDDIIHRELSVLQALDYAAQLRLPPDTSTRERRKQVVRVLEDLELTHRRNVVVKNLSGGQRKRVSIGVELLTKPSLFFLDEATSGLDPGTELQMMRLLRRLADQGRTILLITHATKNVMMCDMVVFLAKGGRVAYFGPPKQALTYFGVKDFDEIFLKVDNELTSKEWQTRYQASPEYQEYVAQRQKPLGIDTIPGRRTRPPQPIPLAANKGVAPWRQFLILTMRSLSILWQDRGSLILMLALAPLLGILDFVMWKQNLFANVRSEMFNPVFGDPGQAFTMAFLSVLVPVIVGSLAMMREIVKESEIYNRERMVGLKIVPYIFSKVGLAIVLALFQAAVFVLTKYLSINFPDISWVMIGQMYVTLFLATIGGMIMGLLVSTLAPNQNAAPLLTILFLVPQITFAGSILPLKDMGVVGRFVSEFTITRWAYESMVTTVGFAQDVAADPCWNQGKDISTWTNKKTLEEMTDQRKKLTEEKKQECNCLGEKMFTECRFPGLQKPEDRKAVEAPEPNKPTEPAKITFDLSNRNFPKDLEDYQKETEEYTEKIKSWQTAYGEWKQERGGAIAGGEALLSRFFENQGPSYKVDIYRHWGRLVLIMAGMLVILLILQKRKDIV